jgi:hypothetical protein
MQRSVTVSYSLGSSVNAHCSVIDIVVNEGWSSSGGRKSLLSIAAHCRDVLNHLAQKHESIKHEMYCET